MARSHGVPWELGRPRDLRPQTRERGLADQEAVWRTEGRPKEPNGREESERLIVPEKRGKHPKRPRRGKDGAGAMGSPEGKMTGMPRLEGISTQVRRIAALAGKAPDMAFTSLNQYLTIELLKEAYHRTRKGGATGVDGVTWAEYGANLDANLRSLLDRAKSGRYKAPPVRRAYVPKGEGKLRPLGIPCLEDKVLQRAVTMILGAIYEQDFLDCSYGFRPGRSAHQALETLRQRLWEMGGGHIVEADIKGYFDNIDHKCLREILGRRVRDGVIRRLIDKWLSAGVMEDGTIWWPDRGTPQGGVISALLANIYLHDVLDVWFEQVAKPRLGGRATLIRFADDFIVVCELEDDAQRLMKVLPKRFGRYGLELHPEKTRMIDFRKPNPQRGTRNEQARRQAGNGGGQPRRERKPRGGRERNTFDFLGFTVHWGLSRKGRWTVKLKTAKDRVRKKLKEFAEWCKKNRHLPFKEQHRKVSARLRGHYSYFGVGGNARSIGAFAYKTTRIWQKWLSRRSQRPTTWKRLARILEQRPLPRPRIVHPYKRYVAKPLF